MKLPIYRDVIPAVVPELKPELENIVWFLEADISDVTWDDDQLYRTQVADVEAATKERCDLPFASLLHFAQPISCPSDLDDPTLDQNVVAQAGCRTPGFPTELPCWEDVPTTLISGYFHPVDCETGEELFLYPSELRRCSTYVLHSKT